MGLAPTYALGLVFIILVTVIWSISSVVVQFLYTDENFDSPFLLTYIGTSLFIIFLPLRLIWERRRRWCCSTNSSDDKDENIIPWETITEYEQIPSASSMPEADDELNVEMDEYVDHDEEEPSSFEPQPQPRASLLSHKQHLRIAMKIAPVWFISNFTYNASLKYTSITSSTVLSSTGSLFTFLFAIVTKDERFTLLKFFGVVFGVLGSAMTGWSDLASGGSDPASASNATFVAAGHAGTPHHFKLCFDDASEGRAIFGDFLGLISAVGYGSYTVMIRVLCPHDESSYSMQLLLGYIGLVNFLSLLPITIYLLILDPSSETLEHLTWLVFGYLVAKGMMDNVLSDYLWARAVILTSATVATVGLGLTIPLAFVSDWLMGHANVTNARSIFGAVSVLVGFTLVNVGFNTEESPSDREDQQLATLDEAADEVLD